MLESDNGRRMDIVVTYVEDSHTIWFHKLEDQVKIRSHDICSSRIELLLLKLSLGAFTGYIQDISTRNFSLCLGLLKFLTSYCFSPHYSGTRYYFCSY